MIHLRQIMLEELKRRNYAESTICILRRIAKTLSAPISTISSPLDRLEGRGLVTRRRVSADRRVVHIELTAAGSLLVTKIRQSQIGTCRVMLEQLNAGERDQLIRLEARFAHA